MTVAQLAERVRGGDQRAVARAITLIEDEAPLASPLMAALHPHSGGSSIIGLTGPPGAGKSTLADRLAREWRARGRRVGIIAVDPTSPFTGGALLGDRVRMQQHAADEGVFIRSMATRGHLGGLARATGDAAVVLEAAGYDVVLLETLGVGQDEVEVVRTADVAIVVVVPGTGDDVQALKAGIMEIADIYVVNKADREGADGAAASIEALLATAPIAPQAWRPPVLQTDASRAVGITALVETIDQFRARGLEQVGARRRLRAGARVRDLLTRRLLAHLDALLAPGEFEALLERIARHETDPHEVAAILATRVLARG